MARHRHLPNAPLREALIDLQFESPVGLDLIDRFAASIADSYERKGDIWQAFFGFRNEGGGGTEASHNAIGRRLEARGQWPYVAQCRTSGFTVSRLTPYGQWDDLLSETRPLWERFIQLAGNVVVVRLGVRYINQIVLPLPIQRLEEYFVCPPRVPDDLPQILAGFFSRMVIPDAQHDCTSVVTQSAEPPAFIGPSGPSINVLFDIDVFRQTRLTGDDATIWDVLGILRDQKNRMFFGYLTETTVERYE